MGKRECALILPCSSLLMFETVTHVHTATMRRVNQVNTTRILNSPWPEDLDAETVSFATRTETVLRRHGLYDDPARFNTLTVVVVAGWTNTGLVTIANIRTTAHAAIRRHQAEADLRARIAVDLGAVASEPWTPQIRHRDPRFAAFMPKGNSTVYDIAVRGTVTDQRFVWNPSTASAQLSNPKRCSD
jgi:hypothetical protein